MELDKKGWEDFISYLETNYSKKTVSCYSYFLKKYLQTYTVCERDVATFISSNRNLKPRTLITYLAAIRKYGRFLQDQGLEKTEDIERVMRIRGPRTEKGVRHNAKWQLTEEEIEKGLAKLTNPLYWMMFWTGVNYGLRASEYSKLKLQDVVLEGDGMLIIREGKWNKTRRIPILNDHKPIWKKWLNIRKVMYNVDHDFVFGHLRGSENEAVITATIMDRFKAISKILYNGEKQLTAHTLRYTFGKRLWRKGVGNEVVQHLFGHEKLEDTMNYLDIREEESHDRYRAVMEK